MNSCSLIYWKTFRSNWYLVFLLWPLGYTIGWCFYRHYGMSILIGCICLFYIPFAQKKKNTKAKSKELDEFMDFVVLVASGLQGGKSLEHSIIDIHKAWHLEAVRHYPIMRVRVSKWVQQISAGTCAVSILSSYSDFIQIPIITKFTVMLKIAKKHGCSQVDVFNITHQILREQRQIEREITVLIAQKKIEQSILSLMPFVMLWFMQISAYEFVAPLYTLASGRVVMTVGLTLLLGCTYWSYRIACFQC